MRYAVETKRNEEAEVTSNVHIGAHFIIRIWRNVKVTPRNVCKRACVCVWNEPFNSDIAALSFLVRDCALTGLMTSKHKYSFKQNAHTIIWLFIESLKLFATEQYCRKTCVENRVANWVRFWANATHSISIMKQTTERAAFFFLLSTRRSDFSKWIGVSLTLVIVTKLYKTHIS